jgi:hypothetical protein
MKRRILLTLGALAFTVAAHAQSFTLNYAQPSLDRWMYPFNASPGMRPTAPVFGTLGDEAGVDSRHGQFLLGFDVADDIASGLGSTNYLIRRATLTATISRDKAFRYDPTFDAFTTFFPTNDPVFTPDTDAGRPIELFGAGFRNGFNAESFAEDAPFGSSASGGRNAFAAAYSANGTLVDVGNSVGKTNAAFPSFEVHPFAIGQTDAVAPGELVPSGTTIRFELNLADPFVRQYLQEGCDSGRLRFTITGLHTSEFGGTPAWPEFYTRDSVLGTPPTLEVEGIVIRPEDSDVDGLPDDWEQAWFSSLAPTAEEDSDHDGLSNRAEWIAGTDPQSADGTLAIRSVQRGAEGVTTITFQHAPARRYVIEYSNDLVSWSLIEEPALRFYSAAGIAEWRDDGSETTGVASPKFYRVRVK